MLQYNSKAAFTIHDYEVHGHFEAPRVNDPTINAHHSKGRQDMIFKTYRGYH